MGNLRMRLNRSILRGFERTKQYGLILYVFIFYLSCALLIESKDNISHVEFSAWSSKKGHYIRMFW